MLVGGYFGCPKQGRSFKLKSPPQRETGFTQTDPEE